MTKLIKEGIPLAEHVIIASVYTAVKYTKISHAQNNTLYSIIIKTFFLLFLVEIIKIFYVLEI